MALTPATLPRHELTGLHVRVTDATNPDLVGVAGRVVRETRNTLVVGDEQVAKRQVPKPATTFTFALQSESAVATDEAAGRREAPGIASEPDRACGDARASGHAGDDVTHVTVDGGCLLSHPARRTEEAPTPGGDDRWR